MEKDLLARLERPDENMPSGDRPCGERPCGDHPCGERPSGGCGCGGLAREEVGGCSGGGGPCGRSEGGCPAGSWGLSEYPLAMVYAPCQDFRGLYDPATALSRGTLFTELDLPLGGCAGCHHAGKDAAR